MYHMEYANVTLLAVQQFYQELYPALSYTIILLTSLEEYLLLIWSLLITYSANIIMIYILYVILNYGIYKKYFNNSDTDKNSWWSNRKLTGCTRVLFVIAHPDDECMFFGPTIVSLVKSKAQVYLVCLSVGDMYGHGNERKHELWSACEALGIDSSSIWLYKYDKLKDDPKVEWRAGLVASLILKTVETLDIDTVITFDKKGVSGHKNHVSIYRAMTLLRSRNSLPSNCRVYLLETVCLLRKYSFYADILLSILFSKSLVYVTNVNEHKLITSAMTKHVSQFVWYRKLFMIFSRYTYINTLSNFIG
ncbi:hypothetical protein O3M35_007356 [Rhynocoris fuscipes]|uniref:N-acetylglucosaminylphosphatidylinositol deacetylase n=1 Tax=Rhynocoris fuscipes TaxID=488301 RepID=A0AAW1D953_9HEMI